VERIEALRRQRFTGQQIARDLGVSPATVSRVLCRLGLNRIATLEPAEPVRRYERERPGELIHIDIKKLSRFERTGHRITGDRTGRSKSRGIGWEYLHLAVDDHSRLAYSEIIPDEKRGSCLAFLFNQRLRFFRRYSIAVERVMTDNGSPSNHAATLRRAASLASATSARDPTRPRPTASPSVSSKPHCASGPTPRLTRPRISADANSAPYSSVTIGKGRI
jgi:transcriptional regulator with XRE-family HTH domain